MESIERRYDVTRKDLVKDKGLKYGAWLAPVVLSAIPFFVFFVLFLLSSATAASAMFFFLSFISLVAGFVLGLGVTGGVLVYRSRWLASMREKIAIDGISADEVEWFNNELTTAEKKALKSVEKRNLLLADAYRDTLAARLTSTRIKKATNRELLLAKRRQNKLKYLKSENSQELIAELDADVKKLQEIKSESEEMNSEAQARLQAIEAAARRGTDMVNKEIALKRLSARTLELPQALESAKMTEEIRKELEDETDEIFK